jgi:hypothetical protein
MLERTVEERAGNVIVGSVSVAIEKVAEEIARSDGRRHVPTDDPRGGAGALTGAARSPAPERDAAAKAARADPAPVASS